MLVRAVGCVTLHWEGDHEIARHLHLSAALAAALCGVYCKCTCQAMYVMNLNDEQCRCPFRVM